MKTQRGATLIEVLVSVLVLAVGLLGLAATQMMSLKNGSGAHHRYMAALAAQEIVERMRANPSGVQQGAYDGTVSGTSTSSNDCSSSCSVNELAARDLYEWDQVLKSNLPSAKGTISRNGGVVTVKIDWKEQHTGEDYGTSASALEDASFEMIVEL
ncbi:type IV pilus modification protein PilV [Microbulbifer thermotolerans]|uniref:type IV pilus modification protein PilV n=1 Tax=Microbulbifer thermotolerans TaxID=252514 RepID=UPI0008EDCD5B|nr:type IV pilus modification protein PilV [Microbulbifer thermotolerans]MCX2795927.1 type IV pilus modification protein PilV [Microbulbifer thermotolerans]MCX2832520.1 type IV pilus modification protein PilV [Microbulbifer thermotolerans]MCX2835616.1 type IV pilus modification protein PilV [Microbulbifer thermotolerans]SFD07913.1 type IV pilus assembly protein PilV [Microbulbifer thermotolerans]